MHLLGFRFAPRIRDLGDTKLYIPGKPSDYPALAAMIGGTINERHIRNHWDEILRLATSIKQGTVTASLMLRKLGSYPERDFVKKFGVARMTVSRALDELATQRILTRVKGTGTFVSTRIPDLTLVEIHDIRDEIVRRGRHHGTEVLEMGSCNDPNALSDLQLPLFREGGFTFRSRVIHFEDDVPIQYEDRHVNPMLFPDYLDQDFTRDTSNAYLATSESLQHAECRISACKPDDSVRRLLCMEAGESCLMLRCQSGGIGGVTTLATLWHPASRFRLAGWCAGARHG